MVSRVIYVINSYFATMLLLCSAMLFAGSGHIEAETLLADNAYNSASTEIDEVDADPSLEAIASAYQVSESNLPSAKSEIGFAAELSTPPLTPKQRAPPIKNV